MKLNEAQKILLTKIDQYIDNVLAQEDLYNPYNRYLPEDLKEELIKKRHAALIEALEKFEPEVELVFYNRQPLWEYAANMKEFNRYAFSLHPNFPDYVAERIRDYEMEIGNTQRLKVLADLKAFYESPDFKKYVLDKNFKDWSRYESYQFRLEKTYYQTNNPPAENYRLLAKEMKFINKPEYAEQRKFLRRRALLWDELRRTGAAFSPEKMKELAELERNPLENDAYKIGIIELGRINAELGIIKENAQEVFPEYYYVLAKQKDWKPERKSLEVCFNEAKELRTQTNEGKEKGQRIKIMDRGR